MSNVDLVPRLELGKKPVAEAVLVNLIELRVERALNLPGRCTLRFAATNPLSIAKVDDEVTVQSPDGATIVFKGSVVALELEHQSEHMPVATVVAYDDAHRLANWSGTATYVKQGAAQILDTIGRRHQLTVKARGVKGDYEYLAQAGSDLEMVDVIASRCSADWWFDEGNLRVEYLHPGASTVMDIPLPQLQHFKVRASADRPDELSVVGWSSTDQKPLLGKATYADSMLSSTAKLVTEMAKGSKQKQPARSGNVPVASKEEADALAEAMLRTSAQATTRVEGVGRGLWALGPGERFKLTEAASLDLEGEYLLTEVEHRYDPTNGSTTRFVCGAHRPAGLVDVLDEGGRSPLRHVGLLVGEVTNINDPRQEGRVKVRFLGLDDKEESNWARVLIPGAGAKRGSVVLPEVRDEVLVGFEGGDLRKPIVLGGMFGSKSAIPLWTVKDGKVTARRTTSRTGHYLEFGDGTSDKEKHVEIQLSDGKTRLRLGLDESSLEIPAGKKFTLKVGNNSSIVFDGNGKIEVKGTDVKITATNAFEVQGNRSFTAKGGAQATVEAPKLELKGKASGTLDGGGLLEIKGGMVKIN
jgi:uncharacterized protein involved in type VI secretion and phage assembly